MKQNLRRLPSGSFLFLQGPASLFFSRLGQALRARGHQVWRINFNGGDRAFWRLPGATDYLGHEADFKTFLARYLDKQPITDIVLLNDCRPLHEQALDVAKARNIATHIFEEGYIRPNWITLEHSGVNGFSSLPKETDEMIAMATRLPPVDLVPVLNNFARRAVDDVLYNAATLMMSWRYRHFKRHWPYGQMAEYAYGGKRFIQRWLHGRQRIHDIAQFTNTPGGYYIFPLQIEADSQIRAHSPFLGQTEVIQQVIASFTHNAPPGAKLVITEHPLETSPINWRKIVAEQAAIAGVADRVAFLAGGSPSELLQASRGIIVINSTIAQNALELGVPVIALGNAIFNLPGITFQNGLDKFWLEARPADPRLVEAFQHVVIYKTQINGSFFTDNGITLAVTNALPRLETEKTLRQYRHLPPHQAGNGWRPGKTALVARSNLLCAAAVPFSPASGQGQADQ